RTASAAGAAKGALKAGKAIAGAAKGATAGPYGMLAAGLWENRKVVGKVLAAIGALLLIPVLFILMLPSLIFGNLGLDTAAGDVL
ncbi:peptidase M23, partial [Klebsiella oxytoca]